MIELVNVSKTYSCGNTEQEVLSEINFKISPGELVAIMGASGSGKSTLMNILGLLDRATGGSYYFNNQEIASLTDDELAKIRNHTIGFVFQAFFLLPRLTALQNVGLPLFYRGESDRVIKEQAMTMLEKVGMRTHAQHRPNQLSGGQQQRVAIARALVGNPAIILADEPTGSLDSHIGQEVMDLFIRLNREDKTTIIIVTHDRQIAEQCQRIVRIKDGEILA